MEIYESKYSNEIKFAKDAEDLNVTTTHTMNLQREWKTNAFGMMTTGKLLN
jgi:hypothetical protein